MLFQIILILFLAGIVCLILILLQPISLQSYNLAVIGSVLDEDTQQPITNALVLLEEVQSGCQLKTFTRQDGGFWFRLQPESKYRLLLLDSHQEIIDEVEVSTINVESKIFDVTLRGTQSNILSFIIAH